MMPEDAVVQARGPGPYTKPGCAPGMMLRRLVSQADWRVPSTKPGRAPGMMHNVGRVRRRGRRPSTKPGHVPGMMLGLRSAAILNLIPSMKPGGAHGMMPLCSVRSSAFSEARRCAGNDVTWRSRRARWWSAFHEARLCAGNHARDFSTGTIDRDTLQRSPAVRRE